jgi:hypothetical protein
MPAWLLWVTSRDLTSSFSSGCYAKYSVEKLCFASGAKIREELHLILRAFDSVSYRL